LINPNKKSSVNTYLFVLLVVYKDAVCRPDYEASNGRIITVRWRLYDGAVRIKVDRDQNYASQAFDPAPTAHVVRVFTTVPLLTDNNPYVFLLY
jgi:hypothetical protein